MMGGIQARGKGIGRAEISAADDPEFKALAKEIKINWPAVEH
jgi:hypothetical protein